jgi:hypothetical protein
MLFPKDPPGTFRRERRARKRSLTANEKAIMAEAVALDGGRCRYPRCPHRSLVVVACHVIHRGMGGNPQGDRTRVDLLISFCVIHHRLYDEGKLDFDQKTAAGTRGPCVFYRIMNGQSVHVGTERIAGVLM